eukprot:TRINITY_DN57520_c0_g1_i1.p1 TRINITY_DN57520_c0_g1~~TRINITY_DN57520_c0_g1_i1.p1  ORF type:complete len:359 (-),score=46.38 TRINITY_DN57520_c0_g1_i1:23-1099(-)
MIQFVAVPVLVAVLGIAFKAFTTPEVGNLEPIDLTGKTFIITGSTSGLGQWQAEVLHSWNATLVLPVRDLKRGQAFADRLASAHPTAPRPRVELLDLSSLSSVKGFAQAYNGPVDVLVHNAALLGSGEVRRTTDGYEECLQVNYLSTFFLTSLLLDRIEASPAGRIVHVSAKAHEWANISVDALLKQKVLGPDFPQRQGMMGNLGGSYADSKLAQILFSAALTRRLKAPAVSLSLHPAIVETELLRDEKQKTGDLAQWFSRNVVMRIGQAVGFMQIPEDAPKTQIHVSTHPSLQAAGGRYYSPLYPPVIGCGKAPEDCGVSDVSASASDVDLQERLFRATCELLNLLDSDLCSRAKSH